MRRTKAYEIASFKALPDGPEGQKGRFEAVVSVFGNVDLQGDRVQPGAFTKSIDTWRASGDPIPIIWSHDWADPFAHIGAADPKLAEETPQGLKLIGQLDVEKPFAAQVYDLLKSGRVREWSFAYDILKEKVAPDKANDLITLDLIEAGPTLKGANPDTVTLGVKAALEKAHKVEAGEKHASAGSYVQSAHDALIKAGAKCASDEKGRGVKYMGMDMEPVEGSYEDSQEDIAEGLQDVEGDGYRVNLIATFDDHVVYCLMELNRDGYVDWSAEAECYSRPYTYDEATDEVTFGDRTSVDIVTTVAADTDTDAKGRLTIRGDGRKAIDDTAWDGAAAMKAAADADDPAKAFAAIAFERKGEAAADTAADWALPHHKTPGAPPNVKGVGAALGALGGARGGKPDLKNEAAAQKHLETHRTAIEAEQAAADEAEGSKDLQDLKAINTRLDVLLADVK